MNSRNCVRKQKEKTRKNRPRSPDGNEAYDADQGAMTLSTAKEFWSKPRNPSLHDSARSSGGQRDFLDVLAKRSRRISSKSFPFPLYEQDIVTWSRRIGIIPWNCLEIHRPSGRANRPWPSNQLSGGEKGLWLPSSLPLLYLPAETCGLSHFDEVDARWTMRILISVNQSIQQFIGEKPVYHRTHNKAHLWPARYFYAINHDRAGISRGSQWDLRESGWYFPSSVKAGAREFKCI